MSVHEDSTRLAPAAESIQIPGYTLERPLASGGMATVYLATQTSLERRVAIKIMSPTLGSDESFRARFLKEGKIIGQFSHPNLITVYDIGVYRNHYFMAMEYISGGTLKERIQQGLSVAQAVDTLRQVALALSYAHQRGFVHRDVKPPNILFREDGTVVLSDFGIAKSVTSATTQMTMVGYTVGTADYMSPEQALAKPVDARSDLYSLGVVFYEVLTGNRPYQATDPFAVALMHLHAPLPRLPADLSDFQPIVNKLLAKEPAARLASAEELLAALERVCARSKRLNTATGRRPRAISAVSGTAAPYPSSAGTASARRRRAAVWSLAFGLPLILLGGVLYWLNWYPQAFTFTGGTPATGVAVWPPKPAAPASEPGPPGHAVALPAAQSPPSSMAITGNSPPVPASSVQSPTETRPSPAAAPAAPAEIAAVQPPSSIPDDRTRAQIAKLLEVAASHREVGYLVEPPGTNATDAFRRVLELDPANEQAHAGLRAIADDYAAQARNSLQNRDPPKVTLELIATGLSVVPDHTELLALRAKLKKR